MQINIANIGNKEWLDFKSDITFGLYFALKELDHDVTISINNLESNKLNIIIGAKVALGLVAVFTSFLKEGR